MKNINLVLDYIKGAKIKIAKLDVERIKKDLKGRTFILNKGLEQLVDVVR